MKEKTMEHENSLDHVESLLRQARSYENVVKWIEKNTGSVWWIYGSDPVNNGMSDNLREEYKCQLVK